MKKGLIALFAGLLAFSSCDGFAGLKDGYGSPDRRLSLESAFGIEVIASAKGVADSITLGPLYNGWIETDNETLVDISPYQHSTAKGYWNAIQTYGSKVLGSDAKIEEQFDKHPWYEYDHWHWYLVVDGTRVAEYEKVGGAGSAAHDHVRLWKSWWDISVDK